jgi:transcriptional regulator with XRE-family HTH domain
MGGHERSGDRGTRKGLAAIHGLGQELREARLRRGLSQVGVAVAASTSQARVSRIERGLVPTVGVVELARLLGVVGMDISVRAYPGGTSLRDAAHLDLIGRLTSRLPPSVRWQTEVPLAGAGEQRAWDLVIHIRPAVAVEAETRVRDMQDLERRIALKKRDSGAQRVVLLLRDTRWNRSIVAAHRDRLLALFPVPGAAALAALEQGLDPGGDALILL